MDTVKSKATVFLLRTVQKVEEAVNTADKTVFPVKIDNLTNECNQRRTWAQSLANGLESLVQPNPALRIEDMVLREISRKKERSRVGEIVGDSMSTIGSMMGDNSKVGKRLIKCGTAQMTIGGAEKMLHDTVKDGCVDDLRNYLKNESAAAKQARDDLENVRLDFDSVRSSYKRAKSPTTELETQLADAQKKFDDACASTERILQNAVDKFDDLSPVFELLLKEQVKYFEACIDAAQTAMS